MKRYHRSYHDHYHYHSHSKSRRTSSDSKTDLRRTILYGSKSEISELLQRNKAEGKSFDDSSRHGRHPLHFLAERKVDEKTSNDFIEELFDLIINEIGNKVNVADNRGETPLHSAAENCNLSIARKLISHKAEVNSKNNEGRTPLHFAAKHSKEDGIIEFLLDNGAHINAEDSAGKTPLHIAAFTFKSDLRLSKALQTLLNRGARVNIRDKKGFVPLFLAFRGNCLDNTGELLRHGADLNDSGVFSLLPRMHDSRVGILVFQHCVKLSDAGLPCNINFKNMMKAKHYNKCHEFCVKEIEKLKETMIQERTSYYNFLHMDPNSRGAFINNEKLREFINDRDLRNKLFHQYAALIQASYYEAVERRQLLEPAKRVWSELTEIELPDICIERIFAYLSNTDLMDLIAGDDRCRRFQATDAYGNKYN